LLMDWSQVLPIVNYHASLHCTGLPRGMLTYPCKELDHQRMAISPVRLWLHVVLALLFVKLAFFLRCCVLVLLVLRDQVVHV